MTCHDMSIHNCICLQNHLNQAALYTCGLQKQLTIIPLYLTWLLYSVCCLLQVSFETLLYVPMRVLPLQYRCPCYMGNSKEGFLSDDVSPCYHCSSNRHLIYYTVFSHISYVIHYFLLHIMSNSRDFSISLSASLVAIRP